jgi:predicted Zn-dependent peptidase
VIRIRKASQESLFSTRRKSVIARRRAAAGLFLLGFMMSAHAELDLRNARVETLDNGLTLILLEDHRFPVASVQMLYRVGARDEVSGKTGLAHFLEHMAFRASKNFPDTDLVSRIYAAGGEWHGYTWIDQTTYFATVPKDNLDLLLQIEADRMSRLSISKHDMDAERGAVLAEMHMYENSPAAMLIDVVNYTSFFAHPYRNNTIGWEGDIENLKHRDVVEFYEQHYHPANAVIAIVGDFAASDARRRVRQLFGSIPGKDKTPLPHTKEPQQNGVRRVTLHGRADKRRFVVAYRAPAISHPDFAAFLVMQEVLGAGSGVNFLQNDWGTDVGSDSLLAGAAESLTTWFPPSAQDYVFVIGGAAPADDDEDAVEQRIESRIASLRRVAPSEAVLEKAKRDVQDALVFDVETTEDAAHQLAFFDGLRGLDTLLSLPQQVAAVSASDVQRVAAAFLQPEYRTIAWHLPPKGTDPGTVMVSDDVRSAPTAVVERPLGKLGDRPVEEPRAAKLSAGVPVILQASDLSPTVRVQLIVPSSSVSGASADDPVLGYSSIAHTVRSTNLSEAISSASIDLAALRYGPASGAPLSSDPETRLEQEFAAVMRTAEEAGDGLVSPALIVVAGDIEIADTLRQLEDAFGSKAPSRKVTSPAEPLAGAEVVVKLGIPVAQQQLGYIVPAPGPDDRLSDAYRLLLYVLSHGYEGRLGKKAISEQGLAYYIGSEYRSDGKNAWITLSAGVDAEKLAPLRALFSSELERMQSEPPSSDEVSEAKNHLLGRFTSAAQSNAELATKLAREWLWYGETLTIETLRARLNAVRHQDVLDAVAAFRAGTTIIVEAE